MPLRNIQKNILLLELSEAIIIGIVISFFILLTMPEGELQLATAVLYGILGGVALVFWWITLTYIWSFNWFIIFAGIMSIGMSYIIYLLIYSMGWMVLFLNRRFIISYFYTGEENIEVNYTPFSTKDFLPSKPSHG